jgi:hypothetical protein
MQNAITICKSRIIANLNISGHIQAIKLLAKVVKPN